MPLYKICIVTHDKEPGPSRQEIARDDLLVKALNFYDVEVDAHPWSEPGVQWETYNLILFRSCWYYNRRITDFLQWIQKKKHLPLCHPSDLVLWNIDKIYLEHFRIRGIQIPDTVFLKQCPSSHQKQTLIEIMVTNKWESAIVKPRISCDGDDTFKIEDRQHAERFQPQFQRLRHHQAYMVQEFIQEMLEIGEWSVIFFDGVYSHTVKQKACESMNRTTQSWARAKPNRAILEFAAKVLHAIPFETTYARIDLVQRRTGDCLLMEAELIEPGLYLEEQSAATFARAVMKRLINTPKKDIVKGAVTAT